MRKFVIACVAVFVGLGCSKTTSPSAMGNTNWLLSCDSDTQCGAEAFCGCGVCTRTCDSNSVCTNLGDAVCDLSANKSCHDVQGLAAGEGVCVPAAIASISDASVPNSDASVDAGYALSRDGALVAVTDIYRPCQEHADCVLVENGCDSCCQLDAINVALQSTYSDNFSLACEGYMGGICDCQPSDEFARCVDGACAAVLRKDIQDCYSPLQNVETAYDVGAIGCACDVEDEAVCIGAASLYCMRGTTGAATLSWIAVNDGVCARMDRTCMDGTEVATVEECLAMFNECYEMSGGTFCGVP